ncbi:hypothetical protein EJ02DRAFT_454293 [Clathrospora elynae]|uniref:Uncharacterized protein n=1 Tax=Clathrospora elynae TaxID=706981 RepID=A0A6A5SRM1_9PLEO|nr:hypothetical protein EJ02DRAFT_454293 [Clathrospora elynae]
MDWHIRFYLRFYTVAHDTCKQGSQHGLTDPNLGEGGKGRPGIAASTSAPIHPLNVAIPNVTRANKAASMASQTQIWERAVKDGLALQPLPPLLYTNDSYP